MSFRSGFITVVGRPNVGKSTLLNALLGEKLLIVSDKPQTTRNQIRCVLTTPQSQMVFIDTPGIHRAKNLAARGMVRTAFKTLRQVDIILLLVDASAEPDGGDRFLLSRLQGISTPIFLVFNKLDLVEAQRLAQVETKWQALLPRPSGIVHVSALTGYNLDFLLEQLLPLLPPGPQYYPDDMVIDQPERFIAAEFIREKILKLTHEEIPHAVAIVIDEMGDREGIVHIGASIYVERESQKGIIIGRQGKMLKAIGSAAREDIENLLGSRIFLDLRVFTRKNWRSQPESLRSLGYEELLRKGR